MGGAAIVDVMLRPFCECLVLVGIHSYLGLHVIRRKVIFVDLALAQVAALGTTVGFLFGMAPDSVAALIFSMLFTFVAAAVFALARLESDKVPQEAVIGLVYAVAAAVVILVIDRAPHGAEHIKEVMTGAIEWVTWEPIAIAAAVYAAVGLVHYLLRDRFLLISDDPAEAFRRGMSVRLWDFLFYLTFGVVISISVRTAGVLLVFVFLVVPAITSTLLASRLFHQLLIGWGMGLVVTLLGLGVSYAADMPSGPTVVAFYGAVLVVASLVVYVARRRTWAALSRVGVGVAITLAAVAIVAVGGRALGRTSLSAPRGHVHPEGAAHPEGEVHAGHGAEEHGHGGAAADAGPRPPDDVATLLAALAEADEERAARLVDRLGSRSREVLSDAFERSDDDGLRLVLARQAARVHGARAGAPLLLRLVRESELPFVRSEAVSTLSTLAGRRFDGFDPEADAEANRGAIEAMERWVADQAPP